MSQMRFTPFYIRRLLAHATVPALFLLTIPAGASGQALASTAQSPSGVPPASGANLSLAATSQHDSTTGWASLLTPALTYRFDPHLSVNASIPIFATVDTYQQTAPAHGPTAATYALVSHNFMPGDASAGAAFLSHAGELEATLSATLGIPTGDPALALGAGHTTFEVAADVDRSIGDYITPEFELALDDSPNLALKRLHKSYVATGLSAHLQGGLSISLPRKISLSLDGYGDLPLGTQKITGKKKKAAAVQSSDGDDNGLMSTLEIPASRHIAVSAFYNRSLYDSTDIAGVTLTFVLRAPSSDTGR